MQYIYLKPQLENLSQGERISFVRQFRRMTQDEVSDKLGLDGENKRISMARYESGDRKPKENRLLEIATILKVNPKIIKEYNFQNSIIFASRYKNIKSKKKKKLFIYLLLKIKVIDPYSRFKIYNKSSLSYIKDVFQYNMYPQNLIYLLYKQPNFIEVKTKYKNKKQTLIDLKKQFVRKCRFNLYLFFILPFIMKKQ